MSNRHTHSDVVRGPGGTSSMSLRHATDLNKKRKLSEFRENLTETYKTDNEAKLRSRSNKNNDGDL